MALTTPSASPAVSVREIDLTGVAPNVQTSTGAFVGDFKWGPINQRVKVSSENELVSLFGTPTNETAVDFLSAAYFLKYSNSLFVVRGSGAGAVNASSGTATLIENQNHWETTVSASASAQTVFAKCAGALGNSIAVEVCTSAGFSTWTHAGLFDSAPVGDEVHVVVKDVDGEILGSAGVLELFAFVSTTPGAKTAQGSNNYVSDVLNKQSDFVWMSDVIEIGADSGENGIEAFTLSGGADTSSPSYDYSIFNDVDAVEVDFLICAQGASASSLITVAEQRKDCVAVISPLRDNVLAGSNANSEIISWAGNLAKSSYAVVDNNFFKVYDKYNDKYVFIPAASSTAGLMAATDNVAAPWFSPAGDRRGIYLGVTDVAYSPSKSQRDDLYKAGINPVANIPGSGVVLYGDKTFMERPSAFDRINVRRLFLTIERSIKTAGKNVMFEFNDEFTRAEFVNIVEPLLREIQGRRGITEFRVVCDESNNTPAVIDRNEFVASIFIKPARSINFVTLNFVAVRTGVEFEEVVGLV
jgi:phage tail sheath protein FI